VRRPSVRFGSFYLLFSRHPSQRFFILFVPFLPTPLPRSSVLLYTDVAALPSLLLLRSFQIFGISCGGEGMSSTTTEPDSSFLLQNFHSLTGIAHSRQKDRYIP
jgi:hypothetical protein